MAIRLIRRTYVDASVYGGAYDEEFAEDSQAFFEQVRANRFLILTSALVTGEISRAPNEVRELYEEFLGNAELIQVDERALDLKAAFLSEGILTQKWADDALHVALASVSGADLIVSWNFRHIVHYDKVPLYNAVNKRCGYRELAIHSPSEVIEYEDEEEV